MVKNLVLILCRNPHFYVKALSGFFNSKNINSIIVSDENINYIDSNIVSFADRDLLAHNFNDMTYCTKKDPCAWDKAFYFLYKSVFLEYDYYTFIEDDVYCKKVENFCKLIEVLDKCNEDFISKYIFSIKENPEWDNWHKYKSSGDVNIYRSFNPFCRLSKNLLLKIFDFYEEKGYLYFHEILFPTICINNNLSFMDYSKNNMISYFFGYFEAYVSNENKYFNDDKINHPIKIYKYL